MKVPQSFQEKLENLSEHSKAVQDLRKRLGKVRFMHMRVWRSCCNSALAHA